MPHRPLRIVVTLGDLGDNGGMRSTVELVRHWNAAGAAARLFVLQSAVSRSPGDVRGVPILSGTASTRRLRYTLPVIAWRLWRASQRADVVAVGGETGVALVLTFVCARLARRPLVVFLRADPAQSVRDYLPGHLHRVAWAALRSADTLICTANALVPAARAFRRRPGGVRVVRNGLHVQQIRDRARQAPPMFSDPALPTVVSAGRLSPQKGYDILLEAHARLLADGCRHRVLVFGEGPERDALSRRAAELGVTETFQLPGHVDNPFPDLLAADLFCLPSRYEGLSRITLEVLALAVPTVATTAVREALCEGAFGRLVPPDDVPALAEAVGRHLRDPAPLRERAAGGPDHVRQFDWAESAAGCVDVFEQLVAQRARGAAR